MNMSAKLYYEVQLDMCVPSIYSIELGKVNVCRGLNKIKKKKKKSMNCHKN